MSDELDAEQIRAETRGYAEELAEWRTERDDLQAEVAKLRSFAQDIMEDWYEGGPDGADLQEIGEKHGLLVPREMAEPCGENCNCAENGADFPTVCYRKTPLLTGDRAMDGPQ